MVLVHPHVPRPPHCEGYPREELQRRGKDVHSWQELHVCQNVAMRLSKVWSGKVHCQGGESPVRHVSEVVT